MLKARYEIGTRFFFIFVHLTDDFTQYLTVLWNSLKLLALLLLQPDSVQITLWATMASFTSFQKNNFNNDPNSKLQNSWKQECNCTLRWMFTLRKKERNNKMRTIWVSVCYECDTWNYCCLRTQLMKDQEERSQSLWE